MSRHLRLVEFTEDPRERVEFTAGLTTVWAVRVDGAIWPDAEYDNSTLAQRVAAALRELDRHGALPSPPAMSAYRQFQASAEIA